MHEIHRHFHRAPHAGVFMARAVARGLWRPPRPADALALVLRWDDALWPVAQVRQWGEMTGLDAGGATALLLLPQVLGFRLLMATLTDAGFALPIWKALQVRNRLRLHRAYDPLRALSLRVQTRPWRVLAKGCEMDLLLELYQDGVCAWEGLTSFYYRGARVPGAVAAPDGFWADPPAAPQQEVAQWQGAQGLGWAFAALTGDYNGVHWSDRYARVLGFPGAFHHPARAVGQCLAHWQGVHADHGLPAPVLDVWVRGPVPYGQTLTLRAGEASDPAGGVVLALRHPQDARDALLLRWGGR